MPTSLFVQIDLPSVIQQRQHVVIEIKDPSNLTLADFIHKFLPSGGTNSEFLMHPKTLSNPKGTILLSFQHSMLKQKLTDLASLLHSNTICLQQMTQHYIG